MGKHRSNAGQAVIESLAGLRLTPDDAVAIKDMVDNRTMTNLINPEILHCDSEVQVRAFYNVMLERRRQDSNVHPDKRPGTEACDRSLMGALIEESLELLQVMQAGHEGQPVDKIRYKEEAAHLAAVAVKALEHAYIIDHRQHGEVLTDRNGRIL